MLSRVANPPNPWLASTVDWLGEPPPAKLQVFLDSTREILSRNDSPDIPFTWSVNPYRGCLHGCAYCYARPSHEYLSFGAGTDFERNIVVKPDAAPLLREAFERPRWKGEVVVFSGNTDCYQPLEASYGITRQCLEVCLEHRNPVGIITKAPLIERDLALLVALAEVTELHVTVSVPFADAGHARALEPYVAPPQRRIETIRRLAAAGLSVGVNVAPVIPGLSDGEMPEVLELARAAGARHAGMILVRLPGPVATVFEERLREQLPARADRVMARIAETRGGRKNDPRFGARMRGEGEYAELIRALFERTCARLGYEPRPRSTESTFHRPAPPPPPQLELFGGPVKPA